DTIRELLPRLAPTKSSRHLSKMRDHYDKTRTRLDELAGPSRGKRAIHPQYLTRLIDEGANDDAVFIPDVGSPVDYAARYGNAAPNRRTIGSIADGSMANRLPMSIGARYVYAAPNRQTNESLAHGEMGRRLRVSMGAQGAFPDRQGISLSGDGGLAMPMGELLTLREHNLLLKIVLYNNPKLNFVELEM